MAGEVQLELAPQTLDALRLQSHEFIQLGHEIFKILRRKKTVEVFNLDDPSSFPVFFLCVVFLLMCMNVLSTYHVVLSDASGIEKMTSNLLRLEFWML